jgi:hypothetical protein
MGQNSGCADGPLSVFRMRAGGVEIQSIAVILLGTAEEAWADSFEDSWRNV